MPMTLTVGACKIIAEAGGEGGGLSCRQRIAMEDVSPEAMSISERLAAAVT